MMSSWSPPYVLLLIETNLLGPGVKWSGSKRAVDLQFDACRA